MKKLLSLSLIFVVAPNIVPMDKNLKEEETSSNERALTSLMREYMVYFPQRVFGAQITKNNDLIWVDSGIDNPIYNYVFAGAKNISEEKVEEIVGYFTEKNRPCLWYLIESEESKKLEESLKENGLLQCASFISMTKNLEGYRPEDIIETDLKLARAKSKETLGDFELIQESNSQLPNTVKEYYSKFDITKIDKKDLVRGYVGYYKFDEPHNERPIVTGIIEFPSLEGNEERAAYLDVIQTMKSPGIEGGDWNKYKKEMIIELCYKAINKDCDKVTIAVDVTSEEMIKKLEKMGFVANKVLKLYTPRPKAIVENE